MAPSPAEIAARPAHPARPAPAAVFQAFRKQRALTAIRPLNEAPHLILPQIARESSRENQIQQRVFTQPGSFSTEMVKADVCTCPLRPGSDRQPSKRDPSLCAKSRHRECGST